MAGPAVATPVGAASDPTPPATRGVYSISVAAELVGVGTQTLRLYESKGLIEPQRTSGGTRRYSAADLARLQRISQLLEAGLNLAGVAKVLELEEANADLAARLAAGREQPDDAPATSGHTRRARRQRPEPSRARP